MERLEIRGRLHALLKRRGEAATEQMTDATGAPLMVIELGDVLADIEREFAVRVPADKAEAASSVDDLIELIEQRIG